MTNTDMKKYPVLLFVRGEQEYDRVDPDSTELVTEGTMEMTETGFRLEYRESELTGMEGTTTTFEITGSRVLLTRSGKFSSQLVFQEGRQHTTMYATPFGSLPVDIQTSFLRHNITERGGVMEIRYAISVDHTVTGRNSFKVRVKRKY